MTQEEPVPTPAEDPNPARPIEWSVWAKRVWSIGVRYFKQVKITHLFKEVLTFTTTSLLLLVIIAIIIAAYKSLNDEVVVVEPINMPKALSDRGYAPEIAAKRIIDEVVTLTTDIKSLKTSRNLVTDWDTTNIQLPAVGLNFNSFTAYLRMLFGIPFTKVSGEVTLNDGTFALRLRIRNSNSSTARYTNVHAKDIDELLRSGAEEFVKGTDPYLLAYYYQDIDPMRTRELITYCLQNEPEDDDIWAANLSGVLELKEGHLNEAADYFRQAIKMDNQFTLAYTNLGFVYGMQDKKEESSEQYDTAMQLGADLAYIYNGKVIIAVKNEDKDNAQHYMELAMQQDKNNPRNYLVRSMYHKHIVKDTDTAIKDLKTALSLSPNFIPARMLLARFYEDQDQYEYALIQYAYLSNASTYLAKLIQYDFERALVANSRRLIDKDRYADAIAGYEKYLSYFNEEYYKLRLGDYYLYWADSLKKEADNLKTNTGKLRGYNPEKAQSEKYQTALDKYQLAIDHNPSLKSKAETHITEIRSLLSQYKKVTDATL